jgi:hypothetical protein
VVQAHLQVVDRALFPSTGPEQGTEFVRADLPARVEQKPLEQQDRSVAARLIADHLVVDGDPKGPEKRCRVTG